LSEFLAGAIVLVLVFEVLRGVDWLVELVCWSSSWSSLGSSFSWGLHWIRDGHGIGSATLPVVVVVAARLL